MQAASGTKQWIQAVLAYAVGSLLASVLVGGMLGYVALLTRITWSGWDAVLGVFALVLSAIEFGLVSRPAALIRRQTGKLWRNRYGPRASALFWGLDVGTGLTTRVTFASFWVLIAACLVSPGPMDGAILLGSYGLGRAALIAAGPFLLLKEPATAYGEELFEEEAAWHRLHGWLLVAAAAVLVVAKSV